MVANLQRIIYDEDCFSIRKFQETQYLHEYIPMDEINKCLTISHVARAKIRGQVL
jgi:hypothetical protein